MIATGRVASDAAPSSTRAHRSSTLDSEASSSSYGSLSSSSSSSTDMLSRSGSACSHGSNDGFLDDFLSPTPPLDADMATELDGHAFAATSEFSDAECVAIADGLVRFGIQCLALDFDQTLVGVHTHGEFDGCSADLAASVRPFFRALVPLCASRGIVVAVVTFSSQVVLIADVLHRCFPDITIPVRGNELKAPKLKRSCSTSALMDRAVLPHHLSGHGYGHGNVSANVARDAHATAAASHPHFLADNGNNPHGAAHNNNFGGMLHSLSSSELSRGGYNDSNATMMVGPPLAPPPHPPRGISRHHSLDEYDANAVHNAHSSNNRGTEPESSGVSWAHFNGGGHLGGGGGCGGGTVSVVCGAESKGKLSHISSIAAMLHAQDRRISRRSTLLLDDDERNVRCALENKIPSVLCRPSHFRRTVEDLLSTFCGGPTAR